MNEIRSREVEQHDTWFACRKCGGSFGVRYAPDLESPGHWMTPVRCPHCSRPQVVDLEPRARSLVVHA